MKETQNFGKIPVQNKKFGKFSAKYEKNLSNFIKNQAPHPYIVINMDMFAVVL